MHLCLKLMFMNRRIVLAGILLLCLFFVGEIYSRDSNKVQRRSKNVAGPSVSVAGLDSSIRVGSLSRDSLLYAHFASIADQNQERIWFHIDKPYYGVGDTIWFRGYLVNAQTLRPDTSSNFIYVDLFDRRRRLITSKKIKRDSVEFANSLILPDTLSEGEYTLRAYTGWMLNFDPKIFFQQNFSVGNLYTGVKHDITYTDKHMIIRLADRQLKPLGNKKTTFRIYSKGGVLLSKGRMRTTSTTGALFIPLPTQSLREGSYVETNVDIGYRVYNRTFFIESQEYDFDIQFLPEGGELVPGAPQRIAFKAIRSDGYPAPVYGSVLNMAGDTVATFRSEHDGMGVFDMVPQKGEMYRAVTYGNVDNIADSLRRCDSTQFAMLFDSTMFKIKHIQSDLPAVKEGACALRVMQVGPTVRYEILGQVPSHSILVGHTRNQCHFARQILPTETLQGEVRVDSLPDGILHLLLVDSVGLPLSERLVYIFHLQRRPEWIVTPDKTEYGKREKVKIDLEIQIPESGETSKENYYSVSVTNRNTVCYDSLSENIYSYLLMTSDLKGYIHNAGYYFLDDDIERKRALDLVMLTHGWRRFKAHDAKVEEPKRNRQKEDEESASPGALSYTTYLWSRDTSSAYSYFLPPAFSPKHRVEREQYFTGRASTLIGNKPASHVQVTAMEVGKNKDGIFYSAETDSAGEFLMRGFDFSDMKLLRFISRGGKQNKTPYYVEVDKLYPRPLHTPFYPYSQSDVKRPYEKQFKAYLTSTDKDSMMGYTLDEVMVAARDPLLPQESTYGRVYDTAYMSKHKSWTVYQYLARLANVGRYVKEHQFTIIMPDGRRHFLAQVRVNDTIINSLQIYYLKGISMEDVKYVGVIAPEGVVGLAPSRSNVLHPYLRSKIYPYRIEVVLKKGAMITQPDYTQYESEGYAKSTEFYHQKYDRPWRLSSKHFDRRATLYWNPYVRTDAAGKALVEFYTDDTDNPHYEITIEGVTPSGTPVLYRTGLNRRDEE